MFHDAFEHLPGYIQTGEFRVAFFNFSDDAIGMMIMVETAKIMHQVIQGCLAGMSKRRMSEIMGQTNGLTT